MDKENGYIQLPYGYMENDNNSENLNFNLPKNFKKELLFDNLPFVGQLNNPAIDNVVKGKENDAISIQKFLLATGLLEDTIQNNLDMIVTDGDFNKAGVRRVLDQKYPTIMGKPTATSFIFKDKAKFDIQNPIIGSVYNEILTDKQKEKNELNLIGNAPSITDLNIKKRLDALGKIREGIDDSDDDDDDDDDNNNNNNNSGIGNLGPPPAPPSPFFPTPPTTPSSSSSSSSIQRFLLGEIPGSSKTAALDSSTPFADWKTVTFSDTLQKVFPKVRKELKLSNITEEEEPETEDFDITESTLVSNRSGVVDLEFFVGGGNYKKLFENASKKIGELNQSNIAFLEYLSSGYGKFLLTKNKMKIHLESGKIFIDEKSTSESLYDFLENQQDETKKELTIDIPIQNDFTKYVREILTEIVDDDYDLQTNSTSKFLFYNFNNVRIIERRPPIKIKHSKIVENTFGLGIIQNHNWQYFVETLLQYSNNRELLDRDSFKDDEDFEDYLIIEKTQENLKYCKDLYNGVFDDISYFFQRAIFDSHDHVIEKMEDDLANHRIFYKRLKKVESQKDLLMIFSNFYFKTGRFPGFFELINVPPGENPDFIEKHDKISPFEINEKFSNTDAYGLASVQFLAILNVFFGGDKILSKNVMSEFLHNLSLQALTIDDDKIEMQFYEIEELSKNLKRLLRDDRRNEIETNNIEDINEEVLAKKDRMETVKDDVETNNEKFEYPTEDFKVMPETAEEIRERSNKERIEKEKNEKALNERDEEISSDFIIKSQKDLMKSLTDNSDILSQDEISNISSSALPKVVKKKKTAEEHIQETKKDNQQYLRKSSSVKLKITPPKKKSNGKKPYEKE